MGQSGAMTEQLVPGYEIVHPIGQGGQAQVYLAEREKDRLRVALKVLDRKLRNDQVFLARFEREYKLVAAMEHEYVARIYDQGFSGDNPFIAMEFLPGGTLGARIHEGFSPQEALRVTSQIALALDAIHARGIVHRDVKPGNILFRADGRPVIVDFGLAKDLAINSNLTIAGQLLATPRYMSPEQCRGLPTDARSDLYSLGVVFYEMLTGEKIWADESPANLIAMHVNAPPPRLPENLAGFQRVLDRMLAKQPEERFQSGRELFGVIAV